MKAFNHQRHGNILVTEHVFNLIEKDRQEDCPQRTDVWYEKRNKHLTASAIATACGANPYERCSTLIRRKTGREQGFSGNEATEHGNKYEQEAIEKYEGMSGEKVIELGLLESLNEGEEFIAGSPDGVTASGRAIEVKCPFRRTPTDKVPDHYLYQVQTIMHILRLPVCDFIQYVPETFWKPEIFIITVVKYDPYFWKAKWPRLQRVWQEILDVRALQEAGTFVEEVDEDGEEATENTRGGVNLIEEGSIIEVPKVVECLVDISKDIHVVEMQPMVIEGPDDNWKCISNFFDEAIRRHAELDAVLKQNAIDDERSATSNEVFQIQI